MSEKSFARTDSYNKLISLKKKNSYYYQAMLGSILKSTFQALYNKKHVSATLMLVRHKMKGHKASEKRLIRTGTGIKRKQAGRNHGNGGFSPASLHHLDHFVKVTNRGGHLTKLNKIMSK